MPYSKNQAKKVQNYEYELRQVTVASINLDDGPTADIDMPVG